MVIFYVMVTAVLALSGVALQGLAKLYSSPRGQALHIKDSKSRPVSEAQLRRLSMINTPLSLVLVYGPAFAFGPLLFQPGGAAWWRIVVEGAAILLLYDFGYYLVHRFLFHEWKALRSVHAVHHTVKTPMALDSLYQHPVENLFGISLLWLATAAVALIGGPISIYSFAWAFLLFSLINVAIHSGLQFRKAPLSWLSYLGVRHYKHHRGMKAGNYGSVTPIFDLLFRTEEA